MVLAAIVLSLCGFLALALGMKRHREQAFGKGGAAIVIPYARPAGFALIALALLPCLAAFTPSMAVTWWLGILTLAAAPILLLLTYRPHALKTLAYGLPAVAAVTIAIALFSN